VSIKNYTSSIPARTSIEHIENALATHGATQILKKYSPDGKVSALCFMMQVDGRNMPFRVPALVSECETILRSYMKRPRRGTLNVLAEQSERTTWKIVSDWLDAEMAMFELGQREAMEIFLPCLYDPVSDKTYFQIVKERRYKGLLPAGQTIYSHSEKEAR